MPNQKHKKPEHFLTYQNIVLKYLLKEAEPGIERVHKASNLTPSTSRTLRNRFSDLVADLQVIKHQFKLKQVEYSLKPDYFNNIFLKPEMVKLSRETDAESVLRALSENSFFGISREIFNKFVNNCDNKKPWTGDIKTDCDDILLGREVVMSLAFDDFKGEKLLEEVVNNISIKITTSDETGPGLEDYLDEYIKLFERNKLRKNSRSNAQPFNFEKNLDEVRSYIQDQIQRYSPLSITISPSFMAQEKNQKLNSESYKFSLKIPETLLFLEKKEIADIKSFQNNGRVIIDVLDKEYFLSSSSKQSEDDDVSFDFDEEKNILKINGTEIDLSQTTRQQELAKKIFSEDTDSEVHHVEVWENIENMDGLLDSDSQEKFKSRGKNARYRINRKIKEKTDIDDDFLLGDQMSTKINPEYI